VSGRTSRVLFQLTAFSATVFVITILAMVAMLLGDPDAPVQRWFNAHGGTVMAIEVVATVLLGLAAMTADRRETLHAMKSVAPPPSPPDLPPDSSLDP